MPGPGGGVCSRGVSAPGEGECLVRGGGGVPGPGGVWPWGGVCSRGVGIPACIEAEPPPPL